MRKGARTHATARTPGRSRLARGAAVALLTGAACAAATSAVAQPAPPAAPAEAPDAGAGEPVVRLASRNEQIKVVERFSKVVTLPDRIARVDGFDQDVIDVTALDSRSIRVHAKSPGVTTMTLLDERDQTYSVDVLVVGDVRHLQELIARLFPTAAIEVVEVRESVVLRGWVSQPDQITEIVEIAEQFYPRVLNQMDVGCVQQVMLKVKVMEVQRSKLRQLGVNFLYVGDGGFVVSQPGGIAPIRDLSASFGGPASATTEGIGAATIALGAITNNGIFETFIEALKQENLLKILAEPNLVTMNGRPANLLAGGEFPILVPNGLGTVGIEYRPFGVRLEAVPIVLSSNRVRVELQSEVSDRDLSNAVELDGFRVPSLTQRRTNTQVELNFGETLVIAGLITQSQVASTSKVPVLGDLPYIGTAFSRKTYLDAETELVIMVTPELVAPMAPGQLPPGGPGLFTDVPTDREFYLYNMIEVPSYGPHCEGQCPPPVPTYDPYHPTGPEHIAPPGAMGPPLPPPAALPPGPSPAIHPAGPAANPGAFPPPAPATSATGS
ncbi:MAG TPA: pilus assembly protein N-terminal domain-containing protein, partial [Planctomycetaceae bacterium]